MIVITYEDHVMRKLSYMSAPLIHLRENLTPCRFVVDVPYVILTGLLPGLAKLIPMSNKPTLIASKLHTILRLFVSGERDV
jgi:hypothetical protein